MKINAPIKKHLFKIAEAFAKDQMIGSRDHFQKTLDNEIEKFERNNKIDLTEHIKKYQELNNTYQKAITSVNEYKAVIEKELNEHGLMINSIYTSSKSPEIHISVLVNDDQKKKIKDRINYNSNIQWDVILSTVALKLELCSTYEEAKQLIEDVTGANVDTMITTIIPPNMQLTNNN